MSGLGALYVTELCLFVLPSRLASSYRYPRIGSMSSAPDSESARAQRQDMSDAKAAEAGLVS